VVHRVVAGAQGVSAEAFEAAKRLFLEGLAAHEGRDHARAEALFLASLERLPGRVSTLVNLAAARLALDRPADALAPLDEALAQAPDDADVWCQRGQVLGRLRRLDDALASFDRALALNAGHAAATYHRGMALNALHRPADASTAFERLVELQPDSAEAHFRRGQTLQRLQRPADALLALDRALELRPADHAVWTQRGSVLAQLGRNDDAAQSFREALRHGGDAELNGWYLGSLTGDAKEAAAPRAYVETLFDDYARDFEQHLVDALHYRGHRLIAEQLQRRAAGRRFASALDLGCGSGLCGVELRAHCDHLTGIDLSTQMLARAQARGCYDRLTQAEVVQHLQSLPDGAHDLVVAGDVFIYLGRLESVFAEVQRVLRPGGLFVFTLERTSDEAVDVQAGDALRGTRSRHSARYVRALVERCGLSVRAIDDATLRRELEQDVAGLVVCIER
jgi:predicted TPR repeat methyltransferase